MSVPGFQSFMLPLLELAESGEPLTATAAMDSLARKFNLTEEDRNLRVASGQQRTFDNRVSWARSYMKMAGLIENMGKGVFRITARGKEVLSGRPSKIDIAYLNTIPEFAALRAQHRRNRRERLAAETQETENSQETDTPAEHLEDAYSTLRETLATDVLAQLKNCTPTFFEKVVVRLLTAMGYGGSRDDAGRAIGGSGDEGIDGIINEDRLGLDVIYIQAKRWENTVSRPEIQKFVGALQGQRARKGIFITTSDFAESARRYVGNIESKIILIDGHQLARLMIDFNVGVATETTYEVKRLDSDFFQEA